MAVVVMDLGEVEMLRWTLRDVPTKDDPLHLHLYQNDYTPDKESNITAFVEATFGSYLPVDLDRSSWGIPASVGGVAYSNYGLTMFTWLATSGTQDIYGYYVTDNTDTVAYWAERFEGKVTVSATVPVRFQPLMRLHSEVEP